MKHIICVGAVYIDTILTVPHFPLEDQKLRASKIARRRGGNGANTLEVLAQLFNRENHTGSDSNFVQLHLCSVLPARDSDAAKFVSESLRDVKLRGSCIFRSSFTDAASSYIIQNAQNLSRTIVSVNELPEMTAKEFIAKAFYMSVIEEAKEGWYHFEGRIPDVTLNCVEYLRSAMEQRSFKISVECEKPERKQMAEVAQLADVVFYSKLWAETNGYYSAMEFLQDQLVNTRDDALLCCTWGAQGATVVQKKANDKEAWASVDGWKPVEGPMTVVDTIGAGDTFIAGMLYALTSHADDWTLKQKLAFANVLAGRKVIQEGFSDLSSVMHL